jgi:phage terminase small subunit
MTVKKGRMATLFNQSPVRRNKLNERLKAPVAPLEDQTRPVTPQQWEFIQELVDGDGQVTLTQAALAAGYSKGSAAAMGYNLTSAKLNPHIVAAIQRYRQDVAEKYGTTIERHMRDLQIIRDKALEAGNYSAAVQAEYRRGQALGTIYVERKEIRHGTIDTMSADEVRKKLEEIKSMYGDPAQVIDVTPIVDEVAEDIVDEEYDEEYENVEDVEDVEDVEEEEPEPEPEPTEGELLIQKMAQAQKKRAAENRSLMRNKKLP